LLSGAVEVDDGKIEAFKTKYAKVPVFKTVDELMRNVEPHIVSICTGTSSHHSILKNVADYPVKGIFCEKPLASTMAESKAMVGMCSEKKIAFAVNHTRRWDTNYLFAQKLISDGTIGRVKAVTALYPGQVFNMGTHLMDTVRMLIRKDAKRICGISFNIENVDPSVSGFIEFDEDVPCTFISTGKREDMIFEIDVIGDDGRLRVIENGEKIELYVFTDSKRYSGYRELEMRSFQIPPQRDRFVEAVDDICSVLEGKKHEVNCSGKDGMMALALSISMLESARNNSKVIQLDRQ